MPYNTLDKCYFQPNVQDAEYCVDYSKGYYFQGGICTKGGNQIGLSTQSDYLGQKGSNSGLVGGAIFGSWDGTMRLKSTSTLMDTMFLVVFSNSDTSSEKKNQSSLIGYYGMGLDHISSAVQAKPLYNLTNGAIDSSVMVYSIATFGKQYTPKVIFSTSKENPDIYLCLVSYNNEPMYNDIDMQLNDCTKVDGVSDFKKNVNFSTSLGSDTITIYSFNDVLCEVRMANIDFSTGMPIIGSVSVKKISLGKICDSHKFYDYSTTQGSSATISMAQKSNNVVDTGYVLNLETLSVYEFLGGKMSAMASLGNNMAVIINDGKYTVVESDTKIDFDAKKEEEKTDKITF